MRIRFHMHARDIEPLSKKQPEAAIAYDEKLIRQMYRRYDLAITEPVLRGRWWWSDMHGQDYVIATKSS
jgi:hypothetical protein